MSSEEEMLPPPPPPPVVEDAEPAIPADGSLSPPPPPPPDLIDCVVANEIAQSAESFTPPPPPPPPPVSEAPALDFTPVSPPPHPKLMDKLPVQVNMGTSDASSIPEVAAPTTALATGSSAGKGEEALDHNPPQAIYQVVKLNFSFQSQKIVANTLIFLVFAEPVGEGFKFRLHSRGHRIQKVSINCLPAKFVRRDALRYLSQSAKTKKKMSSGRDLDASYRGALEISHVGELEITVPDLTNQKLRPPKEVPIEAHKDVIDRHRRVLKTFERLVSAGRASANYSVPGEDDAVNSKATSMLLQVEIDYVADLAYIGSSVCFRQQPALAHVLTASHPGSSPTPVIASSKDQRSASNRPIVCAYTVNHGQGSLRNPDGVRLWLPCLDFLDQRLVFDISLKVPHGCAVACTGVRIQTIRFLQSGQNQQRVERRRYRHFTTTRVPAMQLGFFVGTVESYKMNLYRVKAKIWVATNLQDYVDPNTDSETTAVTDADVAHSEGAALYSGTKRSLVDARIHNKDEGSKRPRAGSQTGNEESAASASKSNSFNAIFEPDHGVRRLYEDEVYHSMLGMDLAVRILHKFLGHRYDYDEMTIVFIAEMGCDFFAFDGVVCIDAKFLHGCDQICMETPCHLAVLKGYLYSWLQTSLTLASYDNEWLLHGLVGYLMSFYIEEVFGDDDGQFYRQKVLDTVMTLEKQGRGMPLCAFYPERYEQYLCTYGQYLLSKSTALFQLIEDIVGGREPMRVALKFIVKSPLIFAQQNTSLSAAMGSGSVDHLASPYRSWGNASPLIPLDRRSSLSTPDEGHHSGGPETPATQYAGYQSPNYYGNMSPYGTWAGASPTYYRQGNAMLNSPLYYGQLMQAQMVSPQRGAYSPSMGGSLPTLLRDYSETFEHLSPPANSPTTYPVQHHGLPGSVCVCMETFLAIMRRASEVSTQLDDSFLERYIYSSGVRFIRYSVTISAKVESKPRTISIVTEQILHEQGVGILAGRKRGQTSFDREAVSTILVEDRDDYVSEPTVTISDRKERFQQQAHSKPGRKGGKRRKMKDTSTMTPEELEALRRKDFERELRKSALQLARDMEYPIRYCILNPGFSILAEIHNASCDTMLIEQICADYESIGGALDQHRVQLQIQALRSIARSHTSAISSVKVKDNSAEQASATGSIISIEAPEKSARLQIKACTDCLLGSTLAATQTVGDPSAGSNVANNALASLSKALANMSVYVRAEAAFALAAWQNENAPCSTVAGETQNAWPGMDALIDCILDLYVDNGMPLKQDPRNEPSAYLKNSMLLALSTIKSLDGFSPLEVIVVLLLFAEQLQDFSPSAAMEAHQLQQQQRSRKHGAVQKPATLKSAPSIISFDESRDIGLLFLALSRVRYFSINVNDEASSLCKITAICKEFITAQMTEAKAQARMDRVPGDLNRLPRLPGDGVAVAAAISCLAEIDIQICNAYVAGRLSGDTSFGGKLDNGAPYPFGLFTRFPYLEYFLPPGSPCKFVIEHSTISAYAASQDSGAASVRHALHHQLCSVHVRLAAMEGFVHLCFAMHFAFQHRRQVITIRRQAQQKAAGTADAATATKSSSGTDSSHAFFLLAAMEGVQHFFEKEPDSWMKQQAALIFLDALQERPLRTVAMSLSMGCMNYCMGWSDPLGLTLPHCPPVAQSIEDKLNAPKVYDEVNKRKKALTDDCTRNAKSALKILLDNISRRFIFNQTVRATLLHAWLYLFQDSVPEVFKDDVDSLPFNENSFPTKLRSERLVVAHPSEQFALFEQMIKHGNNLPQRQQSGNSNKIVLERRTDIRSMAESSASDKNRVSNPASKTDSNIHSAVVSGSMSLDSTVGKYTGEDKTSKSSAGVASSTGDEAGAAGMLNLTLVKSTQRKGGGRKIVFK